MTDAGDEPADRSQRSLSLRQWQEVQALPRALTDESDCVREETRLEEITRAEALVKELAPYLVHLAEACSVMVVRGRLPT